MRARAAVGLSVLFLGCTAHRPPAQPTPASPAPAAGAPTSPAPGGASALVLALADEYLTRKYAAQPENATLEAWPAADHGTVQDVSPAAQARWQAFEDDLSARLHAVVPAGLTERALLTRAIVLEEVNASRQLRICRRELWAVRASMWPWQTVAVSLASVQPVGTAALRVQAVARLRGLARMVDAHIANLREGLRLGYTASRENVAAAIAQVDALIAPPPRDSPLARPAARDGDPAFRASLEGALAEEFIPAARRYRDFLAVEYAPGARAIPGILALPDGAACYRAAVRSSVTLEVPAQVIHETGLAELARIRREMEDISERSFGTRDVSEVLRRLRADPIHQYRSPEAIIGSAQAALDRAWAAAPKWFARLPAARVRIRPYEEFRRASAPADSYEFGTAESGGQGTYRINAFVPPSRSRAGLESTAFHETVPGHHLQLALARETADVPVAKWIWNSAYTEGWGLYAEGLAEEMGLFSSDVDRMGRLSAEAVRATRLVVDSGMHALGWSHQQAVDYMLANTSLGPERASSEVDRYAAVPGQAVSYLLGALEIRRLRSEAQRALGPRFDIRVFHDVVLGAGTLPLTALRERVEAWVARSRG
jgi:uncharacterized protein (DUF885 family)